MSVFQPGNIAYGFSQALVGVFPPPILSQRDPTSADKASIGTVWINESDNDPFILTSIVDNTAVWVNLNSTFSITDIITDDGTATPSGGIINLLGGANIVTSASGDTIDVAVTPNINLPQTNAAGTQGVYQIAGFNFAFAYPISSTFIGINAGNTTSNSLLALNNVGVGKSALSGITTGNSNTAVGQAALASCTTGLNNVAVGNLSMNAITIGDTNIAIGNQALENITTGNDNITLGFAAGSSYTGSESSNIIIGSNGVLSESHVIRIGEDGSGTAQQDECFIAGIYNRTYGSTSQVLFVDNTGKIGSSEGTNGQVLISSNSVSPVWANITAGSGIGITNGSNSITIASTASPAIEELIGDNSETASGSTVTIAGGNSITTDGNNASELTINVSGTTQHSLLLGNATGSINSLGLATNGEIPIGSTGADPVLSILTAGSGVSVTNGAGSITIANTQTQGIVTIDGSTGSITGTTVIVGGGNNITTSGSGATLSINVTGATQHSLLLGNSTGSINSLGVATNGQIPIGSTGSDPVLYTITAGSGVTVTNGAGTITIAATGAGMVSTIDGDTGSATGSTITFTALNIAGSTVEFSASGSTVSLSTTDGNDNTCIGSGTGSGSARNSCLGRQALKNISSGSDNVAVGDISGVSITSGSGNTCIGSSAGSNITTGSENIAIGYQSLAAHSPTGSFNLALGNQSGNNYTGAESSNILIMNSGVASESNAIHIGTQGSGNGQQDTCYIAGIAGVTVASSAAVLINTSTGQLGTVVSSRRYKQSINAMDDASSNILDLNPVTFTYKNDPTHEKKYGLIAEEVDAVFPDLVIRNKAGDPDSVKYHDLPVLLLNELQKQHNIIAELSRRLDRLEGRSKYESKN